jgi:hypothetical protein
MGESDLPLGIGAIERVERAIGHSQLPSAWRRWK